MAIEGLLGKKLGMVQRFETNGEVQGVTVLEAGPCLVTQIKTVDTDGYDAVQLGYGAIKEYKVNQPMKGHFKPSGGLFRHIREFKVDDIDAWKVGQRVGVDLFKPGDLVDVTSVSKGKGFAGGVKRHGFHGGPKTHGQSDRHRAPGSVGSTTTPGRVLKGLRMAGHMGSKQITVRNLVVVEANAARGILMVKGAVPGGANGLVRIRRAKGGQG
ncbi:MAG: 50S ribosomal protein L3 [Dehalococcoidia bacterium]